MLLEGRCNSFSVDIERKYKELFLDFKTELELADTDRRLSYKSQQAELVDQFQKIRADV